MPVVLILAVVLTQLAGGAVWAPLHQALVGEAQRPHARLATLVHAHRFVTLGRTSRPHAAGTSRADALAGEVLHTVRHRAGPEASAAS